jgi:hypothetical protein
MAVVSVIQGRTGRGVVRSTASRDGRPSHTDGRSPRTPLADLFADQGPDDASLNQHPDVVGMRVRGDEGPTYQRLLDHRHHAAGLLRQRPTARRETAQEGSRRPRVPRRPPLPGSERAESGCPRVFRVEEHGAQAAVQVAPAVVVRGERPALTATDLRVREALREIANRQVVVTRGRDGLTLASDVVDAGRPARTLTTTSPTRILRIATPFGESGI